MNAELTLPYARHLDQQDPIHPYRSRFFLPQFNGSDALYFCGNSLGLRPKGVKRALLRELEHWSEYAVEGHFQGDQPWMHYHKFLKPMTARLVGAKESEVVVMNTLTVNLHLMMVSFYRPDKHRFKIIMESGAFPSDQYAVESQVRFHGYRPEDAIIEVAPRTGEHLLRTDDILDIIRQEGSKTALVLFSGVQYYTGQLFDMRAIAQAAHHSGAQVGFDLAHAAGNVPLQLHEWGPDFAVWCSYKYLNAGPGGPSGVFVHERHAYRPELPRFAGWWGHDEAARFDMKKGFKPMKGADGWQLSNAQIFAMAAHQASLTVFDEVGMDKLRHKSMLLTGYLQDILKMLDSDQQHYQIITPTTPTERGCQLSLLTSPQGRQLFDYLHEHGVIADWREPNVIRFAPVPLYNSFEDVYRLGKIIEDALLTLSVR